MTLPSRNDYISHPPEWMAIPMVCLKPPTHIKCNKATGTSRSNKSGKQVLEQYLINAVCSFLRGTFWRRTSTWEVVEYYSLSPICSLTSKHSQIKFRTCIPDLKTCRRGSVTRDVRRWIETHHRNRHSLRKVGNIVVSWGQSHGETLTPAFICGPKTPHLDCVVKKAWFGF